jgi:hypothetical protein
MRASERRYRQVKRRAHGALQHLAPWQRWNQRKSMAHAIMRTMAIRNHNGDFFSLKNASHFGCQNRKTRRWSAGLIPSIC